MAVNTHMEKQPRLNYTNSSTSEIPRTCGKARDLVISPGSGLKRRVDFRRAMASNDAASNCYVNETASPLR